jgi:SNF2 family DNA or RNA helicase
LKFTLFKHQNEAVSFVDHNRYPGSLLWHEMGLGKTLSSLIALKKVIADLLEGGARAPKVLVLLPKSMLHQWRTETQKFTPEIYGNIIYLPYSQLNKAKHLTMYYDFRAIVMDESHYIKSQGTNRIEDLCNLLEAIGNSPGQFKGGKYIALSGTPMLNHAAELFTTWALLTSTSVFEAADRMRDEVKYEKWKQAFTKSKLKSWKTKGGMKYGQDAPEGVKNEGMFNQLIGPVVHFRRASDCLDLPLKQEIEVDLGLDDDKLLQDADIEKPEAYMAILERLARAKTPHAIDWIGDFLKGSQEQIIVFSPYKFPLREIGEKFKKKCVFVTGDQNDAERRSAVQAFQDGKARIFLTTFGAGGVGLNLQNAHNTLYLGYPWTDGAVKQAMARTHRYGQVSRTLHYFLMSGQCDSRTLSLVRSKEEATQAVEQGLLEREQSLRSSVDKFI